MIKLDANTKTDIGFKYVMDSIAPCSPYGEAKKREQRIYSPDEREELERQLENTFRLTDGALDELCGNLARRLMLLKDIRRIAARCKEESLSEVELFELKRFLLQLGLIAPEANELVRAAKLRGMSFTKTEAALAVLDTDSTRGATFYIADSASPELYEARREKKRLETLMKTASPEQRDALSLERSAAAAREDAEETVIRAKLCRALAPYVDEIERNMDMLADLDFCMAKADFAKKWGGTLPKIADGVSFSDMVNPRVADALRVKGRQFTPVSIELSPGAAVITGANMGGKSVAIKTLALNIVLIHAGILPAAARAETPLFDGLFMISEDLENIDSGLSSFGAEIVRFNAMLSQREGLSLVMLDEFARGTNPEEGAMIVRGVVKYLQGLKDYAVLTTHYDNVAPLAARHYQVKGLKAMDISRVKREIDSGADGVSAIAACMDYGLFEVKGEADCPHDALNICRLLSLPDEILKNIENM